MDDGLASFLPSNVAEWLRAFVLTQMVELVVHAHAPGLTRPWRERAAIGFGASAITHPIVWFVIPSAVYYALAWPSLSDEWWVAVAIGETFAVLGEAVWLRLFGVRAIVALGVSLFANAWSFSLGLIAYRALGW